MPISQLNEATKINKTKQQKQPLPCQDSDVSKSNECQSQLITIDNVKLTQVTHILVAIGSNHEADIHIPFAKTELTKLSKPNAIKFSTEYRSPDYTASISNPKPDYTNLCICLELQSTMKVVEIIKALKSIETFCLRNQHNITSVKNIKKNTTNPVEKNIHKLVTLDLDLLAIVIESNSQLPPKEISHKWLVIKKRFPFKEHEKTGIQELGLFK